MRALVVAMVLATSAHAEPLVLARNGAYLRLSIETNLRTGERLHPLSFAPDAWYGATDQLTVGVLHSSQSVDRIDSGSTFCVRRLDGRCDRVYRGSGVEARWAFRPGVVGRIRALVRDVDPVKPAVTAGALLRWQHGRFSVTTDPYLRIGLQNRGAGNRDALVLPVWLGVRAGEIDLAIHTGVDGELATWRDGWHVPFALVAEGAPAKQLVLGVEVGFASLFGPQNTIRQFTSIVFAGWRIR